MTTPLPAINPYSVLAPIYDRVGGSNFAEAITPQLLLTAQATYDWVGRKVIDVACGTGASARFLAGRGMNVTAIDIAPEMIALARESTDEEIIGLRWGVGDARTLGGLLQPGETTDLIFALGLVNHLGGLRELEAVLRAAAGALGDGKMLIFDMDTVEGLYARSGEHLLYEDDTLMLMNVAHFEFERQISAERLIVFRTEGGPRGHLQWRRSDVEVLRRGYPVQAVGALATRCGFSILSVVDASDSNLHTYQGGSRAKHVLFFCRKGNAE